jgi:CRISPR/Cas system-associated protein Cas10 (large subunit of type III CRISPR-Cas system)
MSKYLYGAAVQGIQDFIFQTNKLKEIIGASELVDQVCTSKFAETLGKKVEDLATDPNAIVNAAGNIKYIFDDYNACQDVVRVFPKKIIEHAPGITISQAVEKFEKDEEFEQAVLNLEKSLRSQRNKPMRSPTIGLMGIERSRQTGLPVIVTRNKDEHIDAATYKKLYDGDEKRRNTTTKLCQNAYGSIKVEQVPFDINNITGNNDWIAIIHADGNGLGQVVQRIGTERKRFKDFSQDLDKATKRAAKEAFDSLRIPKDGKTKIPLRPIVLSGDDHTLICRADLALPYVNAFIQLFEKYTGEMLADKLWYMDKDGKKKDIFTDGSKMLSACAGIAFIKSSYPFYYAYQLAEELCSKAKKDTKEKFGFYDGKLPPSCIMFHKVQDSFVTNYDDIVNRELTPFEGYSLKFGPYYINKVAADRWTVAELVEKALALSLESMAGIKSGLRQWLTAVSTDPNGARQRMERLKMISKQDQFLNDVFYCWEKEKRFPIYDVLAINSVNYQKTK